MTETERQRFIALLDKSEKLAGQFSGGYSGEFLSAEEFHQALSESIHKFKEGDNSLLCRLHLWFLPTFCWDNFVGKEGESLANEISGMLSYLVNQKI